MSDSIYTGCVIPARLPFVEAAFKYICETAGLDVKAMNDVPCCMEPVGLKSLNHDAWLNVSSHVISKSEGGKIVTLCDGCAVSLSCSVKEKGEGPEISDLLEFIYDNLDLIKQKVTSPINMKLALFPGCHCESILSAKKKDAFAMMSEIMRAIGIEPLIPEKNLCCGGGVSSIDDELSKAILNESVDSFRSTGGQGVVTVCPFCFMQFDMVARYMTYHIAELVAKAMGWDFDTSKFHRGKL